MNTEQAQILLKKYLIGDVISIMPDLEKSHGSILVDARDGREYLDCFSYLASNPLGHNHPKLEQSQFKTDILRVAKTKVSNSDFFTLELARFLEVFVREAVPEEFTNLFFIEGGAPAVENALKAAIDWKCRKNIAQGRGECGKSILYFKQAFHGRTGYALSVTDPFDERKTKYFPKFDWPRVSNPHLHFPLTPENESEANAREQQTLSEIAAVFEQWGDDIAGIIIEPIQGEGGDNHFRPEFHQALRRIADEREVILIYDEIQTGIGLTGKMWAYEHYGIVPDIVCFGKRAQVCGIMATARIDEVEKNVFVEGSRINSTWGGSLSDMIRCARYLEIIAEDKLVENASHIGEYLQQTLSAVAEDYPAIASNPRGKGLMCAIDLNSTELRNRVISLLRDQGVLTLGSGRLGLRFRPPLIFKREEVDALGSALRKVLSEL